MPPTPPEPAGDPGDRASRGRARSGLSVRTRLTLTLALLTALALGSAGAIIYALESARRDAAAVEKAAQEVAELRQLSEGNDPATAAPFSGPEPLLRLFLERNVPAADEMLVAWAQDRAVLRSPSPHPDLASHAVFEDAVRRLLDTGGQDRVETTYGDVLVVVQPVQADQEDAALAVVVFLDREREALASLLRTYVVVALLSMVVITGLAAWQGGRLLAPVRRLSDTAREITVTDLSRRIPETGNDDITALTRTVNGMLSRLETSFSGQRQFLDDAGHELRTPLTVLAGHLELLDPHDPDDVEQTRALLLDEVDRMSRLVDDLILLAKSRRPDFVTPVPVDVARLTHTLLAKGRALGPREWRLDGAASCTTALDEQRITQAVLQLVDNAVKHTDPDDTVAVGSAVDGAHLRLWVRDTGDGIPEHHREVVLERFGRGRVRPDDAGFGLGLSIVRAIAEAHGGTVTLDDTPGGGATVGLRLPLDAGTPADGPEVED